ncbi:hypothetical protein D3C73_881520 [compost metagenome]
MQSVGSEIADHVLALLGDIGACLRRCGAIAINDVVATRRRATLWFRRLRHPVVDGLDLAVSVEIEARMVRFGGLAVDLARLLRQFRLAPAVHLDDGAALRQVRRHPFMLGAKIAFDIGGVAAVLIGRREQILDPFDTVGLAQIVAKAGILRIHALLGQCIRHRPPGGRITLLRFMRLPDFLLLDFACSRDDLQLLFGRHIAQRHLFEHGRQDIGQQAQFADLANGQGKSDGNHFFCPAEGDEPLDTAPLVDRVQRFAHAVFDHRAHGPVVVRGVDDEDLDFLQASGDREADAAMAHVDDKAITAIGFRRDDGWLDDTDGLDGRQHQRIGLRRRFGLARTVGIFLQSAGIDLLDLHGRSPFGRIASRRLASPSCLHFFSKTPPGPRGGRTAATAAEHPCRTGQAGPQPCEGQSAGIA